MEDYEELSLEEQRQKNIEDLRLLKEKLKISEAKGMILNVKDFFEESNINWNSNWFDFSWKIWENLLKSPFKKEMMYRLMLSFNYEKEMLTLINGKYYIVTDISSWNFTLNLVNFIWMKYGRNDVLVM